HQKVVEEAPAGPLNLAPALRAQMGEAATRVAQACDYSGAGTVEFLLDGQGNFYFLEMNTRLQVEHPVTELITGVDLVEEQIRVARNEPLRFQQEDLTIKGHAIELRVYAEDPLDNFLPSIGTLATYKIPRGAGIRVDDGFEEGMEVPIYYDPMIAKLITYGATREEALQRMRVAIDAYKIDGIATTLPFGRFVADHEAFISGNFDTGFVKEHYSPEAIINERAKEEQVGAIAGAKIILEAMKTLRVPTAESGHWLQNRR
ncbi:MAG: biotin carboxylase, partial [Bacteroidota bacterium]